jgi:hypothetical protein
MISAPSLGSLTVFWSISSPDMRIESGVRYGRVPRGATESSPAVPLESGDRMGIQVEAPLGNTIGAVPLAVP